MAGAYKGLNKEDMHELQVLLKQKSDKIEEIAKTLGAKLKSTTWDGPDADKFRDDWDGTLHTKLMTVAKELETISNSVKKQRDDQIHASA